MNETIQIRAKMDNDSMWLELKFPQIGNVIQLSPERTKELASALMDVAMDLQRIDILREI